MARYVQAVGRAPLFAGLLIFDPKGAIALQERNLIATATGLMLIVVVPVLLMTALIAWRYRASNTKATYLPDWEHGKTQELTWWTIPSIIIGILAVITWTSSHALDPYQPLVADKPPITIQVVALDWKWLFLYPEQGIATVNFVQFPVDTPINFHITADAPMNSFWIPQLAGQIYAMPGMRTKLHVIANHLGDYMGVSANFSGAGFAGMRFTARASSQEDFDAWVRSVQSASSTLSTQVYGELAQPSSSNPAQYFSAVEKGLYLGIIDKFTNPAAHADMREMQPE